MKKVNNVEFKKDTRTEQDLFKEFYPLVLSVVEEIRPLLSKKIDQREVLAMASMHLGQLLRSPKPLGRRDLKKEIEHYLEVNFVRSEDVSNEVIQSDKSQKAEKDEFHGSRILIVDDSAMARRQIQFFLEKDGLEVFEAKNGEEALWLVNEVDPELVLMDVSMEGLNGMETCRRLKQDPANSNLPIVFLSAKGEREEIVKGFRSGAVDYIVKPFHPAESLTRIRTHLRVKKLAEQQELNIIELKQLNKTKDRILRIASHDLRNPISAIAGLAEFLKEDSDNLSEETQEIINCIVDAGKSVVALLNELLDLTAMDSGKVDIKLETVDMRGLVNNLIPLFRRESQRKNIELTPSIVEPIPEIRVDPQQIRRLIDNLVTNAIKFTPGGGKVVIRLKHEEDKVWIQVDDTGPGIPEKESANLFKEFGKTSNAPTGGEKSTGLGLSICARIVDAHGGTIGFENLPEGGARFSVSLPAMQS